MELQLSRHNWPTLRTPKGNASLIPHLIQDLLNSENHESAEAAGARIEDILFANGLLCEASLAVAECMVHALWKCPDAAIPFALNILIDIADGSVTEADPDFLGKVRYADCMSAVALGFPAYVEILDSETDASTRAICIDLICSSGVFLERIRNQAIYYLTQVLKQPSMLDYRILIENSLRALAKPEDT
ncbi:hypothetical protein [Longispora albida]|uniref:hypothetical protein n=1 Tax=Longispora albida TaxID=203523 RepID=UPI0012F95300|nr:hypothetical protein [Longispora albida]